MQRTPAIYGAPPKSLGIHEFDTSEMMFWLYCPIKLPNSFNFELPDNLKKFAELIVLIRQDIVLKHDWDRWSNSYVYLSAKTMYVSPGSPGNRLGWHSDGFLTDDVNYIWSDLNPTLFFLPFRPLSFSGDHALALAEMSKAVVSSKVVTYPDKTLLSLDQTVIHAVSPEVTPGVRTFLKVSVSDKPYGLRGNSINHKLDHPAPMRIAKSSEIAPGGIAA